MPELIDRDETIAAYCADCCSMFGTTICENDGMCRDIDVLKKVPAVNRWIPVEDSLPEENVYVLAWVKRAHKSRVILSVLINGIWKIGVNDCSDGFNAVGKITHWMNLPEPPKGEQK